MNRRRGQGLGFTRLENVCSLVMIAASQLDASWPRSHESSADCLVEPRQAGLKISLEMHAKRSSSPPCEHIEIATRLRSLDNTEARFPAGDLQIPWIVGGDLKKNAAVRAALVGLPS